MRCQNRIWGEGDGLVCLRTDRHDTGHIFSSSWCPDEHDRSEAEATR